MSFVTVKIVSVVFTNIAKTVLYYKFNTFIYNILDIRPGKELFKVVCQENIYVSRFHLQHECVELWKQLETNNTNNKRNMFSMVSSVKLKFGTVVVVSMNELALKFFLKIKVTS